MNNQNKIYKPPLHCTYHVMVNTGLAITFGINVPNFKKIYIHKQFDHVIVELVFLHQIANLKQRIYENVKKRTLNNTSHIQINLAL